ncbi:MAG TPA: hypothetical protein VGE50_09155 [Gammaproteobacteria bacterium]
MQLDQISANIRERTLWEGADLGFVMARHWFWPLWALWWLTALPVILLSVLLLHEWPFATALLVWWCKPAFEPLLLFWLSRRLFGEELALRETVGQWRRMVLPRLLANLTLRRFSPNRSFYMPVSHLEGLRGTARNKRLEVLSGSPAVGTWLTVVGAHLEGILEFSLLMLLFYLIPDELQSESVWTMLSKDGPLITWLSNALWLLAMSIIAPFYVAGGFALYLTRRSQLEAWDLELSFRRMAPRLKMAHSMVTMAMAALLFATLSLPMGEVSAGELAPLSREQARQTIDQVLSAEDFGKKQSEEYWKYIGPDEKPQDSSDWNLDWNFDWLPRVAELLEYLLWLGGALLLGWLLYQLSRFIRYLPGRQAKEPPAAPTVLFGLPVTPESLPRDIAAAIEALLAEQKLRTALSLLYRATLVHLIHDHQLRIPDSATEGECERIVTSNRPDNEAGFFVRLTRSWIWCAYGNAAPGVAEVKQLVTDWQRIYGPPNDA